MKIKFLYQPQGVEVLPRMWIAYEEHHIWGVDIWLEWIFWGIHINIGGITEEELINEGR